MGSAGGGDLDGAKLGDCEDSETVIEKFVASIGSPVIACGKSVEAGLNTRHVLELWFGFGLGQWTPVDGVVELSVMDDFFGVA
jgi:hypothetical protein